MQCFALLGEFRKYPKSFFCFFFFFSCSIFKNGSLCPRVAYNVTFAAFA